MSRGSETEVELPPTEYMRLVCGELPDLPEVFDSVGRQVAQRLGNLSMLEPGARLLDIGCGCGRVARHLLDSSIASYHGFDRHPGMTEWAQSHIGARDARFQFQHVDVQSGYEEIDRSVGTALATEFVFPYDDAAFTGALAASVFTHIDFPATRHYLEETARVLTPGGRLRASFFLDETTGSMGGSGWNFVIREDELLRGIEQVGFDVVQIDPAQPPIRQRWFVFEKSPP